MGELQFQRTRVPMFRRRRRRRRSTGEVKGSVRCAMCADQMCDGWGETLLLHPAAMTSCKLVTGQGRAGQASKQAQAHARVQRNLEKTIQSPRRFGETETDGRG